MDRLLFAISVFCCLTVSVVAGETEARENAHSDGRVVIPGNSRVAIASDRADALYRCGEKTVFSVAVKGEDGALARSGTVSWRLDNYGAEVLAEGTADLAKENPFTVRGTMAAPGFLRISVWQDGDKRTTAFSTAYEWERIRTAVPKPKDFDRFWDDAVAKLARKVPVDPQVEPVPGYPRNGMMMERVSVATAGGRRVHGVLAYPVDSGRYPVRIEFPGAGPGAMLELFRPAPGRITLLMNSHYYRVGDDAAERDALYAAEEGEWRRIHGPNRARAYPVGGLTLSREQAHYYGIILGCNRLIDWLVSTRAASIDPSRVVYSGASQGGGFGLILTALNKNIRRAYAGVPALTDVMGCKADGRQSGWPRILEYETQTDPVRLARIEANAPYFDAAYFAERITVPIRLSVGYIDESCAPHAVCAAFNAIPSKDKKLYHGIGGSHGSRNAPTSAVEKWLNE